MRVFRVVLHSLSRKKMTAQIFKHHDFAFRDVVNFLTGLLHRSTHSKLWSCTYSAPSASCQIKTWDSLRHRASSRFYIKLQICVTCLVSPQNCEHVKKIGTSFHDILIAVHRYSQFLNAFQRNFYEANTCIIIITQISWTVFMTKGTQVSILFGPPCMFNYNKDPSFCHRDTMISFDIEL